MTQLPKRLKVNPFTESQHNSWQLFKMNRTIKLNDKQIKYVCNLYSEIFDKKVTPKETKLLILMIDRLDIAHANYK